MYHVCIACGSEIDPFHFKSVIDGNECKCCGMPLKPFIIYELPAQCAWCKVMLNGPFKGIMMPTLSFGTSHGMCASCGQAQLLAMKQRRIDKANAQLV